MNILSNYDENIATMFSSCLCNSRKDKPYVNNPLTYTLQLNEDLKPIRVFCMVRETL